MMNYVGDTTGKVVHFLCTCLAAPCSHCKYVRICIDPIPLKRQPLRNPLWISDSDIPLRPVELSQEAEESLVRMEKKKQFLHCKDATQAKELIVQVCVVQNVYEYCLYQCTSCKRYTSCTYRYYDKIFAVCIKAVAPIAKQTIPKKLLLHKSCTCAIWMLFV